MATSTGRGRLTLDLGETLHRQVKIAAAVRRQTIREFCVQAIQTRLRDVTDRTFQQQATAEATWLTEMTAAADPVLAELWDNEHDAAYDRL
jgi:hypothetical protein